MYRANRTRRLHRQRHKSKMARTPSLHFQSQKKYKKHYRK